jgi:hypothetical protein
MSDTRQYQPIWWCRIGSRRRRGERGGEEKEAEVEWIEQGRTNREEG